MPNDTTEAKRAPSVLLFIPHPDDEVYVLMILVLLCRFGIHVHIICATYAGTDREDECRNSIEVISAVATVSPTFEFLDYQDTKLSEKIPEPADRLRSHIDQHRPSILLTVSGSDDNRDHRAVCEATEIATRYDSEISLLSFSTPSTSKTGWESNCTFEISPTEHQLMIDAGAMHSSQMHKPFLQPQYLEVMARG